MIFPHITVTHCMLLSPLSCSHIISEKLKKIPHEQGWWRVEPVRKFRRQWEKGQFFAILCGRLLWIFQCVI